MSNDRPKQIPMSNSHQPYAESVHAVHQRYEDTSLLIFNQLQKSLGKVAKSHPAGVPLSGARLPVAVSQPPPNRSAGGREAAAHPDRGAQAPGLNPSSPVTNSQNPPQSKYM